jgi:hypothetical protein
VLIESEPARADIFDRFINMQIEVEGPSFAAIEQTQTHQFKFQFYNGGSLQGGYMFLTEFRAIVLEGEGWLAFASPTWQYSDPNATYDGTLTVSAAARPSRTATILLSGRYRDIYGNWYFGNHTFQVRVSQYHSFDVRAHETFIKGKQEQIYTVPVTLTNYGNQEDRFTVDLRYAPLDWNVGITQTPVILPPGGESTFYVYITTPHQDFYAQQITEFILLRVSPEGSANERMVSIVVSLEGFHLTLGETVAVLSGVPPLFMLAAVGIVLYSRTGPFAALPKPWKEEKEELEKLPPERRRQVVRSMKEEWRSGRYFLKGILQEEREALQKTRLKRLKQHRLKQKIRSEWKKSWEPLHEAWRREKDRIDAEYAKREKHLKELRKKARNLGVDADVALPQPRYPPRPPKPEMPAVPEYRMDERRNRLVGPDEADVERILMPLRRNQVIAKREITKLRQVGDSIIENLRRSSAALEKRLDAEIKKARMLSSRKKSMRADGGRRST